MNAQKLNRIMLGTSLALNILLAAGMLWMGLSARRAMLNMIADSAATEVDIQEHVLKVLESGEAERVDALKATLRLNIDVARRMRYKIETGIQK